ncbi:MAG TPA: hypothetical protein VJ907_05910 [Halanaerobiales bacterium]|nr:hypothetical protein [Halanaerobiales bacterium]
MHLQPAIGHVNNESGGFFTHYVTMECIECGETLYKTLDREHGPKDYAAFITENDLENGCHCHKCNAVNYAEDTFNVYNIFDN